MEMMGFYDPARDFQCLDKTKTIPFSDVNDDYCDCTDGSDEPGTSACNNFQFYCQNKGHVGKFIPSNWVNDGYCDCCDGSDEYLPHSANCTPTCRSQADKLQQKLNKIQNDYFKGHEIYKIYKLTTGEVLKKRMDELNKEREETIKSRTENALKNFEEKKKAAELRQKRKDEKIARLAEEAKAPKDEPEHPTEFDPSAEAERILEQEKKTTPSPEQIEAPLTNPEEESSADEDNEHEEPEQKQTDDDIDVNEEILIPIEPDPIDPVPEVKLPDYGPDNVFVHLTNKDCLTLDQNEYTYKLCPFTGTYQMPKGSSHPETNLGIWGRWITAETSDPVTKPLEMIYENGTGCWNGPSRSTNVVIHCGEKDALLSAEEPSRCQYKFEMTSPVACSKTAEQMVQILKSKPEFVIHDEL
ncbi:hypothetical protein Ciccas_008551 [Cichlidogyrus casuarinus]|uniref:Glucosidase 2 subunit beta n=1 Tax=Cichlidogyrus casuarinus TaxID=1844966 RepID=A0ABD2Q049_9PLAT